MGVAAASLFVFLAAYSTAGYYVRQGGFAGWSVTSSLAVAIPLFFVAVGVYLIAIAGPGDDYVDVDGQGVTFWRSNGKTWHLPWVETRFSLRVELTHGITRHGSGGPSMIFIAGRFPAQNYITLEVYDAIMRESAAKGLAVSTGPSDLLVGWTRTVLTRT